MSVPAKTLANNDYTVTLESKATPAQYSWTGSSALWARHELAYRIVQSFSCIDQFFDFFDYLRDADTQFYREFGGEILDQVLSNEEPGFVESFDQRYLKLIQLFSNFDLDAAEAFHLKAKESFLRLSNSLVRFDRILSSTKHAKGIIRTYEHQEEETFSFSILPMVNGWKNQTFASQQCGSFMNAANNNQAVHGKIALQSPIERKNITLTSLDDCDIAEPKWLSRLNTNPVNHINCFLLPSARISKAPTGIAFRLNEEWRYLNQSADIYHYFRVSGKTIFGPVSKHIDRAYVLPRTGDGNYYCSLLNRLPALYGYVELGVDLPIVSTYPLNKIEMFFAERMGLDVDRITHDHDSEILINNAIVPVVADLKALFARYCMTMPKASSPFGKRIYISRENSPDRKMVNEAELQILLRNYGFDVVCMEKYDLEEQMAIASNADIIVAPHGAGLANMIFADSGTSIFELIPEYYMQSSFRQLAADCGHKYSVQLGKRVYQESSVDGVIQWTADIERVKLAIEDVLN
jgi:hypothetical protein